ncbi:protein of unknown function [Paraburkholderia kururiensis]
MRASTFDAHCARTMSLSGMQTAYPMPQWVAVVRAARCNACVENATRRRRLPHVPGVAGVYLWLARITLDGRYDRPPISPARGPQRPIVRRGAQRRCR